MGYTVSDKVQGLLDSILALDEVQKALTFIEADQEQTLEDQIDICKVQAPTFHEETRAKHYKTYYEKLGLENVHIDEFGNCIGSKKGEKSGRKIFMEGHLDTVFPFGTVIEPKRENGNVYAPGICDDTRGLAVLLSVIRAFAHAGIKTSADMIYGGTVEEEGMGGLGGIKKYLCAHNDIDACICVDGFSAKGITYEATGFRTYEATFRGIGGHAYGAFGKVSNALHAAARAVAKIADMVVPDDPKTTFCVSNFHAGNDAGIHAIVPDATIKFNFRSNSQEELLKLDARIFEAIQQACDEETAKWGQNTITWDCKQYVDVPAGKQDKNDLIVQADYAIIKALGEEPAFMAGGSTNANIPIALGIPAVCTGLGGIDNKVHSLEEFFPIEGSYLGVQQAFLLILMSAGIEGKTPSLFDL